MLVLKADFLSSQKPLAASQQVLTSSQNNFLSSHEYNNLINIGLLVFQIEAAKSSYYDHSTTTLDQRFPYKESEERDPLVTCSEAFQMIGPINLSHSTGGIWV